MGVGDDVAVGIDDEAGADSALASDDHAGVAALSFQRTVAGHQDLDDAGRNLLDEGVDGLVEFVEGVGGAVLSSGRPAEPYKDGEEAEGAVGGFCGGGHGVALREVVRCSAAVVRLHRGAKRRHGAG